MGGVASIDQCAMSLIYTMSQIRLRPEALPVKSLLTSVREGSKIVRREGKAEGGWEKKSLACHLTESMGPKRTPPPLVHKAFVSYNNASRLTSICVACSGKCN